jgi:hypothetical protein
MRYMTVSSMTKEWARVLLFSWVALSPYLARAVPLEPGTTVSTPGTTLADRPDLEGDIIESNFVPFAGTNALHEVMFIGTLVEAVVSEHGTSTLDFYYALVNDAGSRQGITSLAAKSLTGFLTDVDSLTDSGGDVGSSSAARDVSGAAVQFNFANPILPGQTSNLMFVKTNSFNFGTGNVALTSDAGIASIQVFAPIPEPTSVILWAGGILGLLVWRLNKTVMYRQSLDRK